MERVAGLLLVAVLSSAALFVPLGCGGGGGGPSLPRVAVLTNEAATPYAADVAAKIEATGLFARVDTLNAAFSTPGLSQLQDYDAVLVYTADSLPGIADTTVLGNHLADYVDQGGGLVVAFAAVIYNQSWPEIALGGRYVSNQYYLIPRVDGTLGDQASGAILDSTHPIMAGFTSFHGGSSARADTTAVASGTVILQWADGKPLVVTSQFATARRVDLNFFPPSSDTDSRFWDTATDGDQLMAHSLKWVTDLP